MGTETDLGPPKVAWLAIARSVVEAYPPAEQKRIMSRLKARSDNEILKIYSFEHFLFQNLKKIFMKS